MSQNMNTYPNQTVQATPVVVMQPQSQHQPNPYFNGVRDPTSEEKRCCCTCTRAGVCVFVVMMAIAGTICIGVGGAKLLLQAQHYRMVNEYNDAVDATDELYPSATSRFAAGVQNITVRQPTTATAVFAQGAYHTIDTPRSANDMPVHPYHSYVLSAYLTNWIPNQDAKFTVINQPSAVTADKHVPAQESLIRAIPWTKKQSTEVRCNAEACTNDCGDERHRECTELSMQSYCVATYGAAATFSGSNCEGSDYCGTCKYVGYLATACVVMEDSMKLGFNHHLDSCFYPFNADSQVYSAQKPGSSNHSVQVDFRSAADPFIAMQRITKGAMHFGSPVKNNSSGANLIWVGLCLILIPCSVMCCYRCCCYKTNSRRHADADVEAGQQDVAMGQPQYIHAATAYPVVPMPQRNETITAAVDMTPAGDDQGRLFDRRAESHPNEVEAEFGGAPHKSIV